MPRTTKTIEATHGATEPASDVPTTISTKAGREQFKKLAWHFRALGWLRAPHPNSSHYFEPPPGKGGWRRRR
jgi:hypothetical protein